MTIDFHTLTEHFERVHSRRLALRQAALSDSWPLFEATRNPLFNKSLLWAQPGDDTLVIDRMDAIVASARRGRLTALSAVVKSTGEWVALYRFQPYAANPHYLEMGIWTQPQFWHGRYSLELVRACIDAAFDLSEVPVLVGAASLENRSSCKLMELSGMTPTKLVFRQNEAKAEVELQEFEITRAEWQAARKRQMYDHIAVKAALIAPRPIELPSPAAIIPAIALPQAVPERGVPTASSTRPASRRPIPGATGRGRGRSRGPSVPDPNQFVLELLIR